MNERVERAVGRTWHDERPWEFLTRLTEIDNRMGGHPGERRGADLVAGALTDAGADPEIESFEMWRWTRGRTALGVHVERADRPVERSFEAVALPYSPPGEVRAELADVGYGTPKEIDETDVSGKVVVASTDTPPDRERFVHRMEKYGHAAAAGASAFVFANHVPGQLPPTGSLKFDGEAAIPGVGVSRETGAWLTDYADEDAQAAVSVDATTERGTSQNVVGTLGPATDGESDGKADTEAGEEADEEVVLLAHYDAHDVAEGALDNGCGIATVVTAARLLAGFDLDCRVRVAGVGCEEVGLMGASALADALDPDSVRAVVNVDGAGRHRNLKAYTHGSDDLRELVTEVCDDAGQPVSFEETPHPYSDHWPFLRRGVPALQLHSEPEDGGERGRGWGHTTADTRDKADVRNLRDHAVLTALLVVELTRADVARLDVDELADELRGANAEKGMRAGDIWPDEWD